jgi:hypothetical protein
MCFSSPLPKSWDRGARETGCCLAEGRWTPPHRWALLRQSAAMIVRCYGWPVRRALLRFHSRMSNQHELARRASTRVLEPCSPELISIRVCAAPAEPKAWAGIEKQRIGGWEMRICRASKNILLGGQGRHGQTHHRGNSHSSKDVGRGSPRACPRTSSLEQNIWIWAPLHLVHRTPR